MTWQHVLRTLMVAGLAAFALAAATHARAESGDRGNVYNAAPVEELVREAAAVAPAAEAEVDADVAVAKGARSEKIADRAPATAGPALAVKPLIARYASENDLPVELADAVVRLESRYNPRASNGVNVGLTQINAATARSMGYQGAAAGLLDAETNLRYGLKYLAQAYKLAGGDTCGTILRYQAGHRAQTMTRAARTYCAKVQTILAEAG